MKISFRSNKNYGHRGLAEKIAKYFKGGGHKTAASCFIDPEVVNNWKIK